MLGVHIASEDLGWPLEKANQEHTILLRTWPELYEKLDNRAIEKKKTFWKAQSINKYLH